MQDIDAIQEITLLGFFSHNVVLLLSINLPFPLFSSFNLPKRLSLCMSAIPFTYFFPLLPAMIIFELFKTMFQKSGQKFIPRKKGRV